MKKDKILLIATLVFISFTFIYIGIQHRRINRLADSNQLQSIELSTLKDSVSVYKDKNGELTYKLDVVEVNHRNLKESLEIAGYDIKKLKDRDINWRKVTAALRMQLAATGSGTVQLTDTFRIVERDTVNYLAFDTWSNNFLTLNNGEIFNRQLTFDYQYRTGIDFLTTGKRRETVVSVILSDPNAAITTGNSIAVKHEKKWHEKRWLCAAVGFAVGVIITR